MIAYLLIFVGTGSWLRSGTCSVNRHSKRTRELQINTFRVSIANIQYDFIGGNSIVLHIRFI